VREVLTIAVFALVLMSARSSVADHYLVPTGSMQPTVEIDDHVLVNKAAYGLRLPFSHSYLARFDGPAAGDVVVLDAPDEDKVLLKRVVGVPGTQVEVRGGRIWIDGKPAPVAHRGDELYEQLGRADHALRLTRGGGPDWGQSPRPDSPQGTSETKKGYDPFSGRPEKRGRTPFSASGIVNGGR